MATWALTRDQNSIPICIEAAMINPLKCGTWELAWDTTVVLCQLSACPSIHLTVNWDGAIGVVLSLFLSLPPPLSLTHTHIHVLTPRVH